MGSPLLQRQQQVHQLGEYSSESPCIFGKCGATGMTVRIGVLIATFVIVAVAGVIVLLTTTGKHERVQERSFLSLFPFSMRKWSLNGKFSPNGLDGVRRSVDGFLDEDEDASADVFEPTRRRSEEDDVKQHIGVI
eukprot:g3726.t1